MPRTNVRRAVRILMSTDAPGATTKFVDQIVTDAPKDARFLFFSWRTALFAPYDVFHVHWPEFLIRASTPAKTAAKTVGFVLLVTRLRLRRTPIVRTVHNLEPHDPGPRWERALLDQLDRKVGYRIVLNRSTARRPEWAEVRHIPHGHYIDRFTAASPEPRDEHLMLSIGRIEEYKNIPGLLAAFAGLDDPAARLRVVGAAAAALRTRIEAGAAGDDRVALDLRFVSDEQLVREVTAASVVVLPYAELHNSGVALVALSLGRPILAPASDTMRELQREIGSDWVITFDGHLTAGDISHALRIAGALAHDARPDLRNRDWTAVAAAHAEVYRAAVERGANANATRSRPAPAIFVNPSGQRENLGDSVLRRPYVDALRQTGRPVVVLATGDARFTSGLGLAAGDVVIRSKARWLLRAGAAALRGQSVFALNAGEIVLDATYRSQVVWVLPLAILTRVGGGMIVAAGIGLRDGERRWRRAVRFVLRRAAVVSWRDPVGATEMRVGSVHPDWAFETGRPTVELRSIGAAVRDRLVISVRGDRPAPADAWHAAVRQLSVTLGARPLVLSQVARDVPRGVELAESFGCEHVSWTDEDHAAQEAQVRAVYGQAVAVVSDRIHSLILGLTEGAVPVGLTPGDPEKVARTFYFAGARVPIVRADDIADPVAFADQVAGVVERREHLEALDLARAGVADLRAQLAARLAPNPQHQPH